MRRQFQGPLRNLRIPSETSPLLHTIQRERVYTWKVFLDGRHFWEQTVAQSQARNVGGYCRGREGGFLGARLRASGGAVALMMRVCRRGRGGGAARRPTEPPVERTPGGAVPHRVCRLEEVR